MSSFSFKQRSGMTLIELLLIIAILAVLAAILIIYLNPEKQNESALDAQRQMTARQMENAFVQYFADYERQPANSLPTGKDSAMPICRSGVTDPSCVNLDALVPEYLVSIPVDENESDAIITGYRVYRKDMRTHICSDYVVTENTELELCVGSALAADRAAGTSGGTSGGTTGGGGSSAAASSVGGGASSVIASSSPASSAASSASAGGGGSVVASGGTGTSGNPYQLTTCAQLQTMANDLDAYYVINNDIDCSGFAFDPVGDSCTGCAFAGSFDGNGYRVENLLINTPSSSYVGLFGYTSDTATITHVTMANMGGVGNENVGSLVGWNNGTITRSDSYGYVTGTNRVGGLVGANYGTIEDSYSATSAGNSNTESNVGGLVGDCGSGAWPGQSIIRRSYATGSPMGNNRIGGFCGTTAGAYGGTSTIEDSFAVPNPSLVISGITDFGGFIGWNNAAVLTNIHSITPFDCLGHDQLGNSTCTVHDSANEFYNVSMEPMNGWNFTTIWQSSPGNYPTLR